MGFNLKIHNRNHILKSVLGTIEYYLNRCSFKPGELYIVNYHGTQKKFLDNFQKQLIFFQKEFSIIAPAELADFYSNKLSSNKPFLLITFDDGIKNNLEAAYILDKFNIKAFFFIVPKFIDTTKEFQKDYFIKNIRPAINHSIDSEDADFTSLSREDLKILMGNNHLIGSHTYTHTLMAKSSSLENSTLEIVKSKEAIEQLLSCPVRHFCSINNTLLSVGIQELKLIQTNYSYHFTTLPGSNTTFSSPYFLKRINIESFWLPGAVKYALGKWGLKRWEKANKIYLSLLKSVSE